MLRTMSCNGSHRQMLYLRGLYCHKNTWRARPRPGSASCGFFRPTAAVPWSVRGFINVALRQCVQRCLMCACSTFILVLNGWFVGLFYCFAVFCSVLFGSVLACRSASHTYKNTPEARETLEILVNWCDLCLPANEQAFAEAHRIKIQHFQASIVHVFYLLTS